jgi:hypothetical protein
MAPGQDRERIDSCGMKLRPPTLVGDRVASPLPWGSFTWSRKETREMGKRNDVPLKEKYRLWWEYLRRDDELKEWFEWLEEYHSKRKATEIVARTPDKAWEECGDKHLNNFWRKIPKKFKTRDKFLGITFKYEIDDHFGNIFEEDFDEWWRDAPANLESKYPSVEDYIKSKAVAGVTHFENDFEAAMAELKDKTKQKLSAKAFGVKFKRELLKIIKFNSRLSFPVMVHLFMDRSNEELTKDFLDVVENKRKEIGLGKRSPFYKQHFYLMEPFYFKDLKRYLRVYDLRKEGRTYPQIQTIIVKEFGSRSSYYRTLPEDFKIAQQIIKNASLGLFPYYERKKKDKKKQSS